MRKVGKRPSLFVRGRISDERLIAATGTLPSQVPFHQGQTHDILACIEFGDM